MKFPRLISLLFLFITLSACASLERSGELSADRIVELTAAQLLALQEAGDIILVDVRTPYEFADTRIAGALNAPLTHFDPSSIPRERRRETVFYCGSSRRSIEAAQAYADHWNIRVRHLSGGLKAWSETGFDTVANTPDDDPRSKTKDENS